LSEETRDLSPFVFAQPLFVRPARSRWKEYGRPALLFLVTAACIAVTGSMVFDASDSGLVHSWRDGFLLLAGVASIMTAHEMGHYLGCRYYRVDATLPHFLPAPPIFMGLHTLPVFISFIGTFGAFIRIRGPIPHRKALFDIGVAGPLAGFVVTLIVLALALSNVTMVHISTHGDAPMFGEPLLFTLSFGLAEKVGLIPEAPAGMMPSVNQPLLLAAWFGVFLTALNLMPVGQLDGGHAIYALLTRQAARISRVGQWLTTALVFLSPTWLLWAILLRVLGRPHPPTLDDEAPVGRARAVVGVVTLLVFVLCFMPRPIEMGWSEALPLWHALKSFLHLT
jgi:hypothetical protein